MATRYFGFSSVEEWQDFVTAEIHRTIRAVWHRIVIDAVIDNGLARSIFIGRASPDGIQELQQDSADAYDLLLADLVELVEQTSDEPVTRIEFQLTSDGDRAVTIQ